jgi:hypothetical protein
MRCLAYPDLLQKWSSSSQAIARSVAPRSPTLRSSNNREKLDGYAMALIFQFASLAPPTSRLARLVAAYRRSRCVHLSSETSGLVRSAGSAATLEGSQMRSPKRPRISPVQRAQHRDGARLPPHLPDCVGPIKATDPRDPRRRRPAALSLVRSRNFGRSEIVTLTVERLAKCASSPVSTRLRFRHAGLCSCPKPGRFLLGRLTPDGTLLATEDDVRSEYGESCAGRRSSFARVTLRAWV